MSAYHFFRLHFFEGREGREHELIFHLAFKPTHPDEGGLGQDHYLARNCLSHEDRATPCCPTSRWAAAERRLPRLCL